MVGRSFGCRSVAQQIAHPEAIYKTLVAVAIKRVPSSQSSWRSRIRLKKIAKASGNKKVEMLHLRDLEETTGYIRGGCSPIGMKKLFPTYIDESARHLEEIIISAGKRGLQIGLSPTDLSKLVRGQFVSLTAISEVD